MKCANCMSEAVFTVTHPATRPVHYCTKCLPNHLRARANAGQFPLQTPDASKKKSRRKASDEDLSGTSEAGTPGTIESDDAEGTVPA